MATQKMTREQMIEKLDRLQKGTKVRWQGKTYTVVGIKNQGGKLSRRDTNWLEEGKPDFEMVPGKYHAAGKMVKIWNWTFRTLYAQPSYMDFEVVEQ